MVKKYSLRNFLRATRLTSASLFTKEKSGNIYKWNLYFWPKEQQQQNFTIRQCSARKFNAIQSVMEAAAGISLLLPLHLPAARQPLWCYFPKRCRQLLSHNLKSVPVGRNYKKQCIVLQIVNMVIWVSIRKVLSLVKENAKILLQSVN